VSIGQAGQARDRDDKTFKSKDNGMTLYSQYSMDSRRVGGQTEVGQFESHFGQNSSAVKEKLHS
jgi:hypothetical protein